VGAGPGDPDLLTIRALRRLRSADVVFYDGLVSKQVLTLAPSARLVPVARRVGPKAITQEAVNTLMIAAAREGHRVVRLKSGDPFVFGRGGEEARALRSAGVQVEVVPGLSSALAAPALAGIPVTYRDVAATVVLMSGHDIEGVGDTLHSVPARSTTLVIMMGLGHRAKLKARLVAAGWGRSTPVAIVVNASRSNQAVWRGSLGALGSRDGIRTRTEPGVIIIGDVVALATPPEDSLS
jgi:uroporphyrin-III C-methyltransferase/precorrin-2 dehydrogenase/sirohydrochlorin ferrochelatase